MQHLNEFNTITNQLSIVEIEFDDDVRALILLASLLNSWEAMRITVSNFIGKSKLKYDNIRDLILSEEVRRRDVNIDKAQDLSWRTREEVEAEDLMIINSMVGHNEEIDLSSRKLENASCKVLISIYLVLALIPCQICLEFFQSFFLYVCGFFFVRDECERSVKNQVSKDESVEFTSNL